MPDLLYQPNNAAAARMIAVFRNVPAPDGTVPAADATNAVLWAHVKVVVGAFIRGLVKDLERGKADADLDTVG